MKLKLLIIAFLLLSPACSLSTPPPIPSPTPTHSPETIKLPEPQFQGNVSLEEALLKRRSVREYSDQPLALSEVSQLLWAAQGKTAEWGGRTAPSAGGIYPLEVYAVTGNVTGLAPGVYRYRPDGHELIKVRGDDTRRELAEAALDQACVRDGAIDIIITGVYERTRQKYGDRAERYVHLETGHAAQNICLQATALDLGAVTVGAFFDEKVREVANIPEEEAPLYIIPVGKKR